MRGMRSIIAHNLQRLMRERGLKAKPLSILAGRSITYVTDILTGRVSNPRTDTIASLAEALGCSTDDLTQPPPIRRGDGMTLMERCVTAAERVVGEDEVDDRPATVARLSVLIHGVLVEREIDGRPIEDIDEVMDLIEELILRIRRGE